MGRRIWRTQRRDQLRDIVSLADPCDQSTGGSSSGSCSGVAAVFAPVVIGTDTNGSILMPATRHDVYALKPTLGLISQGGICPISYDFDSAGPIAKSARDIADLMDVLVDPSKASYIPEGGYVPHLTKSFKGIRIGVLKPSEWHMPPTVVFPNANAEAQMVFRCNPPSWVSLTLILHMQDREISVAYEKLRNIGVEVREVKVADLNELTVNGIEPDSEGHGLTEFLFPFMRRVDCLFPRFPIQSRH